MNAERRRRELLIDAKSPPGRLGEPRWLLRMRLAWTTQSIERLERALADDFATVETAPIIDELQRLQAYRESLRGRLSQRR